MKNQNQLTCQHIRGNGAHAYVCQKTGIRCPYQSWCNIKRVYEIKATCESCKDFEK